MSFEKTSPKGLVFFMHPPFSLIETKKTGRARSKRNRWVRTRNNSFESAFSAGRARVYSVKDPFAAARYSDDTMFSGGGIQAPKISPHKNKKKKKVQYFLKTKGKHGKCLTSCNVHIKMSLLR